MRAVAIQPDFAMERPLKYWFIGLDVPEPNCEPLLAARKRSLSAQTHSSRGIRNERNLYPSHHHRGIRLDFLSALKVRVSCRGMDEHAD